MPAALIVGREGWPRPPVSRFHHFGATEGAPRVITKPGHQGGALTVILQVKFAAADFTVTVMMLGGLSPNPAPTAMPHENGTMFAVISKTVFPLEKRKDVPHKINRNSRVVADAG